MDLGNRWFRQIREHYVQYGLPMISSLDSLYKAFEQRDINRDAWAKVKEAYHMAAKERNAKAERRDAEGDLITEVVSNKRSSNELSIRPSLLIESAFVAKRTNFYRDNIRLDNTDHIGHYFRLKALTELHKIQVNGWVWPKPYFKHRLKLERIRSKKLKKDRDFLKSSGYDCSLDSMSYGARRSKICKLLAKNLLPHDSKDDSDYISTWGLPFSLKRLQMIVNTLNVELIDAIRLASIRDYDQIMWKIDSDMEFLRQNIYSQSERRGG